MFEALDNLDFGGLCGLGEISKVFSQQEVVSMASPFIGSLFGAKLPALVSAIYGKYRLVSGGSNVSAADAFAKDMGNADPKDDWFTRKATQAGGYVATVLGFGDAFKMQDQLGPAFNAMADDWSSKGYNVVLIQDAVGDSPAPASAPAPTYSGGTPSRGAVIQATAARQASAAPVVVQQRRQLPKNRMQKTDRTKLMWVLGVGGLVFAITIGVLASGD